MAGGLGVTTMERPEMLGEGSCRSTTHIKIDIYYPVSVDPLGEVKTVATRNVEHRTLKFS